MKEKEDKKPSMARKNTPKAFLFNGLLGVASALLVCGVAYAGITAYARATDGELEEFSGRTENDDTKEPESSTVESVVSKTDEVFYDRFEIDKNTESSITIEQAGDESIAGVSNPNASTADIITLLTKGVSFVQIVYPEGDSAAEVAAYGFNKQLAAKTGYLLKVVPDSTTEKDYEILVGATNRDESAAALEYMAAEGGSYAVQTTADKFVLAGKSATALNKAADYAVTKIGASKGEAVVSKNFGYVWKSSNAFHSTILGADTAAATTKKLYDINEAEANGVPQGGCSDGTYFYQMLITKQVTEDESKNECKIVKVNLKTGEVVKISEALPLNHANDITYNSKRNCLVVCHNAPNRDTLSYVDPETLALKETFQIKYEIFSIDYNASRDCYVVGLSGGQTFRILDAEFKAVGKVNLPNDATKSHTTQGVGSDDEFIYFALYMRGAKSVIAVFDWDGNYVSMITLYSMDVTGMQGREIEDVVVVDGQMYITCASTTWKYSQIYKITDLAPQQ